MTLPHSAPDGAIEDDLRRAMEQTSRQHRPSAIPMQEIIRQGKARRTRRRTAFSAAGAVLAAGLILPFIHFATGSGGAEGHVAAPPQPPEAAKVSQVVGSGAVDGMAWSVALDFYPTVPKDYKVPARAGVPAEGTAGKGLVCRRVVLGGVRVDRQGGAWSGCHMVNGAYDAGSWGGAGLHGMSDKGVSGSRIFVGRTVAGKGGQNVTRAEVTLKSGKRLAAEVNTVAGTGYGAFAVPIGQGQTIASVDQYAGSKRLTHETFWH
ncbi:hypothetical protein ABZV60_16840 [Streptomyces sp. NPDC004787]|uniref:hypothetical protein n=1 Tax=Streptomyces sp. NPDC004787 TaxID=3154291 RepID=UPI0033A75BD2